MSGLLKTRNAATYPRRTSSISIAVSGPTGGLGGSENGKGGRDMEGMREEGESERVRLGQARNEVLRYYRQGGDLTYPRDARPCVDMMR